MREDGTIQPAKVTHFTQQGYQIKGIIHAGMNDGEEVYSYKALGIENIVGFEPLPFAAEIARREHGVRVEEIALANKNGKAKLIVTKGDGKGSSIYKPILESEEVKKHWKDNAIITGKIEIQTQKFITWYSSAGIQIEDYDCLVLDTQGTEMEILEGCGVLLQQFKYLSIELSIKPVYEGETPAHEVVEWLDKKGFLLDSPIYEHNDSFFIRKDIKSTSDQIYRGLG